MGVKITLNDSGHTVVDLPIGINWTVEPSGAVTVLGGESVNYTVIRSQCPGSWATVELIVEEES